MFSTNNTVHRFGIDGIIVFRLYSALLIAGCASFVKCCLLVVFKSV